MDVKNGFAYVLTFFSLISDGLGGVQLLLPKTTSHNETEQMLTESHNVPVAVFFKETKVVWK